MPSPRIALAHGTASDETQGSKEEATGPLGIQFRDGLRDVQGSRIRGGSRCRPLPRHERPRRRPAVLTARRRNRRAWLAMEGNFDLVHGSWHGAWCIGGAFLTAAGGSSSVSSARAGSGAPRQQSKGRVFCHDREESAHKGPGQADETIAGAIFSDDFEVPTRRPSEGARVPPRENLHDRGLACPQSAHSPFHRAHSTGPPQPSQLTTLRLPPQPQRIRHNFRVERSPSLTAGTLGTAVSGNASPHGLGGI